MDVKAQRRKLRQCLERLRCQRECLTGLMELRRSRAEQPLLAVLDGAEQAEAEFERKYAFTLASIDRLEEKLKRISETLANKSQARQQPKQQADIWAYLMSLLFGRDKDFSMAISTDTLIARRRSWDRFATLGWEDPCASVPSPFWTFPSENGSRLGE
uniref:Uncharacterized protein n=1 Tax=Trichuris muris TaxID=70415 RepID=A0A5S6Q7C3_TRIMR